MYDVLCVLCECVLHVCVTNVLCEWYMCTCANVCYACGMKCIGVLCVWCKCGRILWHVRDVHMCMHVLCACV